MANRKRSINGIVQLHISSALYEALDNHMKEDLTAIESLNNSTVSYNIQILRILGKVILKERSSQ